MPAARLEPCGLLQHIYRRDEVLVRRPKPRDAFLEWRVTRGDVEYGRNNKCLPWLTLCLYRETSGQCNASLAMMLALASPPTAQSYGLEHL